MAPQQRYLQFGTHTPRQCAVRVGEPASRARPGPRALREPEAGAGRRGAETGCDGNPANGALPDLLTQFAKAD